MHSVAVHSGDASSPAASYASASTSGNAAPPSGPASCAAAGGYAAPPAWAWNAAFAACSGRRLGRGSRGLWRLELGGDLAARGVLDKGRVGGQKGGIGVVWAVGAGEGGRAEVGVILGAPERVGDRGLRGG